MTMLAQNTFTVKRATKDGYSCSLSSYSVMLNADSNGVVNGLSAASTTVKLYQGSTAVTPVISIDSVSNCSASISGLNVSIVSIPNNTKSGYVDVKVVYSSFVKIERYSFTVVDYTIVKSYTQSIVGDQMTSYATKTTVDTLGKTVLEQSTKIEQNSKDIALKASQSDVTALGNRMKSAEASITPDAINLTVKSQINTAVANVQIGGRNLLLNSKTSKSDTSYNIGLWTSSRDFIVGETLTVTIKGSISSSKLFGIWFNGGSYGGYPIPKVSDGIFSTVISVPSGTSNRTVGIYLISNQSASDSWTFEWIKLEWGNKATDWSPAPEDVDSKISLRPTTDEIKAQFTIDTGGISMLGKKIRLDGMVTFSSLASDAQNKISSAQSAADAANSAAGKAQSTADGKASTTYVDDAKGAAISAAASDAATKAGQAKTDAINAAALDATGKASTALSSAKSYTDSLKGSLGDLAWESTVGLAKLDNTIIDGGYIKTNLINAVKIVTQGLSAQTIDAGNATLKNLTVDTATVKMATLVKASGTFTELRCVNDKGSEVFSFNSTAVNIESVDMYNQGTKDGRALRFYASDIRCRGSLGAYTRNYVIVNMGIASYYVNGDTTSSVKVNLGTTTYNGRTYYMIPLYPAYGESGLSAISATGNCQINDVYGFPVDEVIIINNAGSYYYNLIGYAGKKVTLVNATDSFNNNYFASCENAAHQLKGGVTMSLINVNPFFMSGSRTINSINKSCWMIAGWYDNDFN